MSIHPTAVIDPSARIGSDVQVGPYTIIGKDCQIGDRSIIHSHAVLEFTTLGEECQVYPHACLGLTPQHARYAGEPTRLVVGKKTILREGISVHRGTPFDAGVTTIGDNCFLMGYSHVAHDCRLGNNVTMANGVLLAGHVTIGDNVFISGTAAVHQFGRIGKGAMISGNAMCVQDVAPFCIAQGDRAVLRGINVVGMRRTGIPRTSIRLVKDAYRVVFLEGRLLKDALAQPELNVDDSAVREFRDFLATPKRGFTRPAAGATEVSEEEAIL